MTVSFKLWHAEMKEPVPEADRMRRATDRLQIGGYWRIEAARTKPDYPVLIWTEAGKEDLGTIFQIGQKVRNTVEHAAEWDEFTQGSWLWCRAVSKADYAQALTSGVWPDGKPARQMTAEEKLGIDVKPGDNNAPQSETLAEQIASLVDKIDGTLVTDQASADVASGLLDKMRKLLELAADAHKVEKQPHWDAGLAVDAKWAKIRDPGISAGKILKAARDNWLKKEQDRLDAITAAENKKRRDEAEAENRKRREEADALAAAETERLRKEAEAHGQIVDENEIAERVAETVAPVVEVKAETIEAPKAKASSAFGRGTTAKKTKVITVTDAALLINFLLDSRHPDPELAEWLQKKAEKIVKAKMTAPGITVEEI